MASDTPTDGGVSTAKDSSTLLQGDLDEANRRKVTALIDDALEFFRTTARTNDYFTGYSLAEVITERISLIGEKDDDLADFVGAKRTLISRLNYLQAQLIGEDGKSGIVQDALDAPTTKELNRYDE